MFFTEYWHFDISVGQYILEDNGGVMMGSLQIGGE